MDLPKQPLAITDFILDNSFVSQKPGLGLEGFLCRGINGFDEIPDFMISDRIAEVKGLQLFAEQHRDYTHGKLTVIKETKMEMWGRIHLIQSAGLEILDAMKLIEDAPEVLSARNAKMDRIREYSLELYNLYRECCRRDVRKEFSPETLVRYNGLLDIARKAYKMVHETSDDRHRLGEQLETDQKIVATAYALAMEKRGVHVKILTKDKHIFRMLDAMRIISKARYDVQASFRI